LRSQSKALVGNSRSASRSPAHWWAMASGPGGVRGGTNGGGPATSRTDQSGVLQRLVDMLRAAARVRWRRVAAKLAPHVRSATGEVVEASAGAWRRGRERRDPAEESIVHNVVEYKRDAFR